MARARAEAQRKTIYLPELAPAQRTQHVRQTKPNECGLACLAMVAGYHGIEAGLPTLRRLCHLSAEGATLKALMDAAARIGLRARALKGEIGHLSQVALPAILHWNGNHFVVLAEVGRGQSGGSFFVIHDPAAGARTIGEVEVSRHFTRAMLEMAKRGSFPAMHEVPALGRLRGHQTICKITQTEVRSGAGARWFNTGAKGRSK